MSIRDLKTLLAIAETGSFAAAARLVRRSQSAVTVQMQKLEEELGFALFDRAQRPPRLNDAGRAFVPRAAELVQGYERLFQEAAAPAMAGHLRLGVVPSLITGMMPKALVALRAKYPRLHLELAMGLSEALVERTRRGDLDAAIVGDVVEDGAGLRWLPFAREPLVLIAPLDAPRRSAEELAATLPFIRYTRQAWVGRLIDAFLKRRRLRVREAMALDTLEAITAMVHHGLGVSIVPLREGEDALALPVRRLSFAAPPVYRVLGLVHMPGHAKAPLAEALVAELKALWGAARLPGGGAATRGARRPHRRRGRHLRKN